MGQVMSMQDVFSVYVGKRVFVTGHTGFKGSWLAFLLKELGAEVMGYAHSPESERSHFEWLQLSDGIADVRGDVRDFNALNSALQTFKPDFVFHLAAQALVKKSYEDPLLTVSTNVLGSANLLEAVKACHSVRSLVYITSDKCYENVEWIWGYRENDRLGGYDPYSASKAAAELIFSAYVRSYFTERSGLGAASARAGNVIGGGDWSLDRIVPDCVRAILVNKPVQLRNPSSTRPWQHVLEPLSGYLRLGAYLWHHPNEYSEAWNFGPSAQEVRTVYDVADAIVQYFGTGSIEVSQISNQQHEARLLQLNCDKAHQLLGWFPRWSVEQTFEKTAEWYQKTLVEKVSPQSITREQIYSYFPELS